VRIVFYDPNHADYHVGSVFERPLGGTQSAACYLAMELAKRGHEVAYLTGAAVGREVAGVMCPGRAFLRPAALAGLDADVFIVIQRACSGEKLRGVLGARTKLIFWTADTPEQPVVAGLREAREAGAYDAIVTVSAWQRERFAAMFPGVAGKLAVRPYGMSPAFAGLFEKGEAVLKAKQWPPVVAYTSTPFRGLDVLLHLFPEVRRRVPGARLEVYSGMQVYFVEPLAEGADMRELYEAARRMEGVTYVGNLPQPRLAERMKRASMLLYTNTYEETACISVMEAMAAGCSVVTSALGALPETTAGRAVLVDVTSAAAAERFVEAAVERLEAEKSGAEAEEARRREQVDWAVATYDWGKRAAEWEEYLRELAG
jgi:glycosyltransferase involved in cell wall biosynthesis